MDKEFFYEEKRVQKKKIAAFLLGCSVIVLSFVVGNWLTNNVESVGKIVAFVDKENLDRHAYYYSDVEACTDGAYLLRHTVRPKNNENEKNIAKKAHEMSKIKKAQENNISEKK